MNVRPGPAAILCLLASCVLAMVAFWLPIATHLMIALLLLSCIGAAFDWRTLTSAWTSVDVQQSLPTTIGRGLSFTVNWRISHQWNRSFHVETRIAVPEIAQPDRWLEAKRIGRSPQDGELSRELVIGERGKYTIGPAWLRIRGPLGLLEMKRAFHHSGQIDVLPESYWSSQQLAHDDSAERQLLDKVARSRQHGVGTEFESLAEFRAGDDPKRIDWRASARTKRMIIRRFQVERHRDVMILIDSGRLMASQAHNGTKLDAAVDAALMLSRVALQSGDRCGLGVFDDQVVGYLPPISGPQAMRSLVHGVYDLKSRWRESDFSQMFAALQSKQQKRSLVVVLSDLVSDETTKRFRSSLAALARRHVVLFAALRTPQLTRLPHQDVEDMLGVARRAVGFRLLRERERTMHSLRRSAVHVLDVEPNELTVPLINQYVELRTHNTL